MIRYNKFKGEFLMSKLSFDVLNIAFSMGFDASDNGFEGHADSDPVFMDWLDSLELGMIEENELRAEWSRGYDSEAIKAYS